MRARVVGVMGMRGFRPGSRGVGVYDWTKLPGFGEGPCGLSGKAGPCAPGADRFPQPATFQPPVLVPRTGSTPAPSLSPCCADCAAGQTRDCTGKVTAWLGKPGNAWTLLLAVVGFLFLRGIFGALVGFGLGLAVNAWHDRQPHA